MVAGLTVFMSGQQGVVGNNLHVPILRNGPQGPPEIQGVVNDWSHHHLIFSNPGTEEEATKNGRHDEWLRIVNDPRYIMQQLKRRSPAQGPAADYVARMNELGGMNEPERTQEAAASEEVPEVISSDLAQPIFPVRPVKAKVRRDWSMSLGSGGTVGAGMYPAKYSLLAGAPNCANASKPDFVVYNTGLAGTSGDASQTGTVTASSGTGTVTVNSIQLTASPGTAASQTTTITANGAASGNYVKITNPLGSLSWTVTASTPVAQEDQLAVNSSAPTSGSSVTVAGIVYSFQSTLWTNSSVPSGTCYVNRNAGQSLIVSYLASAISYNGSTNGTNTTWYCGSSSTQPSGGVTVTSSTSPNVDVTAKVAGSTGFTTSRSGTNEPGISVLTSASDGSSASPNFQWWSGAAAVSNTTLATNIYTAIHTGTAVGATVTNPSGQVVITASQTGLAGNSISVTTTIASGLSGGSFNGNLGGAAAGTTSGTTFATSTDSTTASTNLNNEATALASAINTNVSAVTATSNGAVVTVTDKTSGSGGNSIGTTYTLTGFSWNGSTLAGGGNPQPTIIAYDNLYSSCSGYSTGPNVYWQYNTAYPQGSTTGDGSAVTTSPVIYWDGTQVAFVESNSSNVASLVLLKWASGGSEVEMDTGSNNVTAANYHGCTAPCMTRVAFGNGANDTNSSPFYDYQNDIIYVGDDSGNLHKFTTVFSGTPTESGSPFATTGTSNVLTSPVYDSGTSHDIFVGDSGGYVYSYNASGTHVATSSQLATGSLGILDAPVIDSSNELMYVFVGKDGNTSSTDGVGCKSGSNNCNGIFRFSIGTFNSTGIGTGTCNASTSTSWGSSGTNCGSEVAFGSAANSGSVFYDGAFDNIYYSGNGTTGNIWACSPKTGTLPRLSYAPLSLFPAAGATYGTTTAIDQLTSAATTCSPVTEVCDNGGSACDASHGTDYIFLSVTASGNVSDGGTACSGACLYGFQVGSNGSLTVPTTTTYGTGGIAAAGGASGTIIDNLSTTFTGAAQIYYSTLANGSCAGNGTTGSGTGGCAVQTSQTAR